MNLSIWRRFGKSLDHPFTQAAALLSFYFTVLNKIFLEERVLQLKKNPNGRKIADRVIYTFDLILIWIIFELGRTLICGLTLPFYEEDHKHRCIKRVLSGSIAWEERSLLALL